MKIKPRILVVLVAGLVAGIVCLRGSTVALASSGQSFTGSTASAGMEGVPGEGGLPAPTPAAADAADSSLCAQGKQAIDRGRWADAIRIFSQVAAQHGEHADGALYWKAYAEYELGQSKPSENSCAELRSNFPKSRWVEDCGALEVEIRARTGKPVVIDPAASDDVKLLALNAMLRQNEPLALAEIQRILNGDSSEKLKKEAEFILGHHYSDVTYAQIVRISYVEGDVRIQRGEPNGKASLGAWEQAVSDLPLETGFSLVTGAGRAEIEFENASTMYLGENSVLTFNDLHETAGIPYTELALLSGTVSLHIHPYLAGEKFILHTPTSDFVSKCPDKSYARIQAFTDAIAITSLEGNEMRLSGVPKDEIQPGRTWTYLQGKLWAEEGTADDAASTAWDKWVADRVAHRAAATSAVMEASGLTEPIPGMAEMQGEGKFFDCAPYGTCWEPNDAVSQDEQGKDEQSANQRQRRPASQQPRFELAAYHPPAQPGQAVQSGSGSTPAIDRLVDFPCTPGALRYRVEKDPVTGRQTVVSMGLVPSRRYDWAVCHAGSWIRRRKHYAWVAGGKRHHIDPVRWVRSGHTVAFVPLHPYDVRGQNAINARHEVFAVSGKNQITVQPVRFEPSLPIEYLKDPPREFRNAPLRPLTMAEVPHMEAHSFAYRQGAKGIDLSRAGVPIHFDAKSQSFQIARQEAHGGKTATVFAPMSNHSGTLQARGGSFAGSSGFHGGSASAGSSRGGGGSSGGGSSHGGGGGVSSASSSSSAASSSSASSSSGGSHH
jgi:hypothetical protein